MIEKKDPLKDAASILELLSNSISKMKFGEARRLMKQIAAEEKRKSKEYFDEYFDRELDKRAPLE